MFYSSLIRIQGLRERESLFPGLRGALLDELGKLGALGVVHLALRGAVLEGIHLNAPGEMHCLRWAVLSIVVVWGWTRMISLLHHLLEPLLHHLLCNKEISPINFCSPAHQLITHVLRCKYQCWS